MAAEPDAASVARVLAHMNNDHKPDLSLYLRHYAGLSEADAADAEMLDVDLSSMKIRSASGTHVVPLAPPMRNWSERREKLAGMALAARAALGPIAYRRPELWWEWGTAASVGLYFALLGVVFAGLVEPGKPLWEFLGTIRFPFGPVGFKWLVKTIAIPVLGIHVGEMWLLDRSRLAPRGIARGSPNWCMWVGSNFFEGVCAFKRFDRIVEEKRQEAIKESKSH